jgi:hypothetical protein
VVNRWNGGTSEADQLPKSELNPLINPVLGRNLGRWAQVYFTTAPEKREQAVLELLHELENVTPDVAPTSAAPSRPESGERTFKADKRRANEPANEKEVACRSCGFRNPAFNLFCGQCGLRLGDHDLGIFAAETSGDPMPMFPMAGQPRILEADDVQWLRDKSLTILEDSPSAGSRVAKSLLVMVFIGLGVFAYLRWSAQPRQVQLPVPAHNATSGPSTPPPGSSQVAGRSSAQALSSEPKRVLQPASLAEKQEDAKASSKQHLQTNSDVQPTSVDAAGDAGTGAQELKLGQRFLDGKTGTRDTSEAAKFLWKAVGKQNASAALLLSDLYMRGDGVSKNCDQARLLLIAAAKRGSSQATEQLRRLQASGCR